MDAVRIECDSQKKFQAVLQWTPPNDTGGEGVVITHYKVNVTGQNGDNYRKNVTTSYISISGLQCNISYTFSVAAVNCVGESVPSEQAQTQILG